jgi:hypothetical protein
MMSENIRYSKQNRIRDNNALSRYGRERPSVAPHPDVDLEKAATCSALRPGISSCTMWNFIPQGVQNCVLLVPHHVARMQRDTAKNVFHRADIECWKLRGRRLE